MNRENEFRAWIDFDGHKGMAYSGEEKEYQSLVFWKDGMHSGFFDENIISIMQYTGLKDKNGNKIYEGDIVRLKINEGGWTRGVEIQWNDETMSLCPGYFANHMNIYWEYEVIGNIYENPELLK